MDQQSVAPSTRSVVGDHLRAVRRRWRLIALVTLLAVAGTMAYSLTRAPEFRSTADVLLSPTTFDVQRGGAEMTPEEIATQIRVATSRPVAELMQNDLRLVDVPPLAELVTVEVLGNSRVLRFTARMSDADEAAEVAESAATSYLTFRQTNTQQTLQEVTATLAERQQRLETRLDILNEALARPRNAGGELEAERRNIVSQLGQITSQLANLDIAVAGGAGGELLDRPADNTTQVAPRPVLNGVLSLLLGLLAGVALALTRDRLDRVAHDEETLVPSLGPAHVLARVPRWKVSKPEDRFITVTRPESEASQAFQGLVARVRFLISGLPATADRGAVLMCTSAGAEEGKTDVAANIAVAAARVGMRVVLVDADMRRGASDRLHGVGEQALGLSDVLVTGRHVDQLLVDGPVDNVSILPAGIVPANPTELVTSARMRPIIAALADRADLVVVDAPSASYADSLEMAGMADVTVLVTRLGRSRLPDVRAAAERLHDVGADYLGAVVLGGSKRGHRVNGPGGSHLGRSTGQVHWAEQRRTGSPEPADPQEDHQQALQIRKSHRA